MPISEGGSHTLNVSDLQIAYGETLAVRNVGFTVGRGEVISLIGSNGAGKSTTLKAIQGLIKPRAGRIELNGASLVGLAPNSIVRAGVAISPEGRRVFPQMTVLENLEIGSYARGRAGFRADLERAFEYFPILHARRSQLAGSLSGGEQQMLAIARALMARPQLLMLDEPSLGLAPRMIERIWEIIQTINRAGTTILLVEQNAYLALSLANRVYLIEQGRTVLAGPSEEMRTDTRVIEAYLGGKDERSSGR